MFLAGAGLPSVERGEVEETSAYHSPSLQLLVSRRAPSLTTPSAPRRILEFAANIKATFEPVVQMSLFPRSQIDINVQVLQSDGSLLQAAINATTLALIDAGVPMNDYVCAVTCALHDNTPLLDVNSLEESDLPNVTVGILPRSGKVTLATLETQLSVERFPEILKLTGEAAKAIHVEMVDSVKARTDRLARAMGGIEKPLGGRGEQIDVDMVEG